MMNGKLIGIVLFTIFIFVNSSNSQSVLYKRIPNEIYGRKDGMALTMDVFQPEKQNGIGIILIVSGNWRSNHNEINEKWVKRIERLIEHGQTVFAVVHSSAPKYKVPEIILDIEKAVSCIRVNADKWKIDKSRLGIIGESSGGHLSLLLAAKNSNSNEVQKNNIDSVRANVQAVVSFFPPTDFRFFGTPELDIMNNPKFQKQILAFIDNPKDLDALIRVADEVSPIRYVTESMPPTLIISGDADKTVPVTNSIEFNKRLEELNVPHNLEIKKGKGHGWDNIEDDYNIAAEWFNKYLSK